MLRLVKADFAPAGKLHLGYKTPLRFLNFGAFDAAPRKGSHFSFQVVAHEIKFVDTILIGRVKGDLCWGQGEDQPAVTGIHGFETQDVAQEGAVPLGIFAVDNHVSARNHLPLPGKASNSGLTCCLFQEISKDGPSQI
jgi:hypothetical protein